MGGGGSGDSINDSTNIPANNTGDTPVVINSRLYRFSFPTRPPPLSLFPPIFRYTARHASECYLKFFQRDFNVSVIDRIRSI